MGTTALNGPVLDGLRRSNSGLISDKRALESDVRALQGEVDTADSFARVLAPQLVGGRLDGRGVLLVTAPGADGQTVEQLSDMLTTAGAAVTGRLGIDQALLDPAQGQLVDDLVASVVPPGVELPEGPVPGAAAELAAALTVRSGSQPLEPGDAQEIVSAFEEAGLVEHDPEGDTIRPAGMAVLVAAPAPADTEEDLDQDEAAAANNALEGLLAFAGALDARSNGAVVAGPADSLLEGGLVRALRADGELEERVSSVDNVDRVVGQVAVVLALLEQLAGRAGSYGGGQGASGPVPTSAPSAAAG